MVVERFEGLLAPVNESERPLSGIGEGVDYELRGGMLQGRSASTRVGSMVLAGAATSTPNTSGTLKRTCARARTPGGEVMLYAAIGGNVWHLRRASAAGAQAVTNLGALGQFEDAVLASGYNAGAQALYFMQGAALKKLTGALYDTPAAAAASPPFAHTLLARTPWDARLAAAGAVSNPSRINFSAEADSESWNPLHFEDMVMSGGPILRLISWRDYLFCFKADCFYVFYGTSLDAKGNPAFDYRSYHLGIGPASGRGVAAGADGVYFVAESGVYRTTGGDPQLVSDKIQGLFDADTAGLFSFPVPAWHTAQAAGVGSPTVTDAKGITQFVKWIEMAADEHRVYLGLTLPQFAPTLWDHTHLLVYDTREGAWMMWRQAFSGLTAVTPEGANGVPVFMREPGDPGEDGLSWTAQGGASAYADAASVTFDLTLGGLRSPSGSPYVIRRFGLDADGAITVSNGAVDPATGVVVASNNATSDASTHHEGGRSWLNVGWRGTWLRPRLRQANPGTTRLYRLELHVGGGPADPVRSDA